MLATDQPRIFVAGRDRRARDRYPAVSESAECSIFEVHELESLVGPSRGAELSFGVLGDDPLVIYLSRFGDGLLIRVVWANGTVWL